MTVNEQRKFILNKYPGNKPWANKVNRMSDNQVFAFYMRLNAPKKEGKQK